MDRDWTNNELLKTEKLKTKMEKQIGKITVLVTKRGMKILMKTEMGRNNIYDERWRKKSIDWERRRKKNKF